MYLKLTTAFNPGMNDAGNSYPIISIVSLSDFPNTKTFQFVYEAGNFQTVTLPAASGSSTTTTQWVKGAGALTQTVTISGTAYATIIASAQTVTADNPYKAVYRTMYAYLISQGNAGTIVDA